MNAKTAKQMPAWLVVLAAFIIPGSGYVIMGKPVRGLMLLFWMLLFGFITFNLTTESISTVGRLSGGFAIWTLSVLESYRMAIMNQNKHKRLNTKVRKARR